MRISEVDAYRSHVLTEIVIIGVDNPECAENLMDNFNSMTYNEMMELKNTFTPVPKMTEEWKERKQAEGKQVSGKGNQL